jgi:glycosyltransferase involved in cell wall biosynthesis
MNKVIVLPGRFDSSFFINELDYLNRYFDKVVIITYKGNRDKLNKLANKKKFDYHMVKNNYLNNFFSLEFLNWLFSNETKDELKMNFYFKKNSLFRILYILFYGLFFVEAKKYIEEEIKKEESFNIYLYSFWLSRTAYTVSKFYDDERIRKIVSRAHGYDLYLERNKYNYLPFRNYLDKNLDEIHFVSKDGFNYFKNKISKNNNENKTADKYVSRLGTFNNGIVKEIKQKKYICIVSCSYINKIKRLDLIIDILAEVDLQVMWVHIGNGDLMYKIKSYAREKLCCDKFEFVGEVDNSEILNIYKKYDVDYFINMSDSEGVPVSIMEAISFGIPIIARDVGGISEIVNSKNGLLIKNVKNINKVSNDISDFIRERLDNIDKYIARKNNSYYKWENEFNAEKNYKNFYKTLIKNK